MHIQELGNARAVTEPSNRTETTPPTTTPVSMLEGSVGSDTAVSEPGTEPHMVKGVHHLIIHPV